MPKIKINGREIEAEEGQTVLQTALANGIYIPHFCYHPHLPIAGNCRMCLVDIKPGPPKLSIACATTVADGMEIDTENEKVQAARQAVMEFILKNHPLDCPICDQAGECALHEYYMKYDLQPSRLLSAEEKITKKKAQRLGKLVLDSERCILCGRCVRFMRDVLKDERLVIVHRRDRAEITTFPGQELDNPYSLCLADICPVGAWTAADFRFKQRVWFLTSSPSVCPMCSRGCNIWIDHRQGEVFRIRPRPNEEINQSFICDAGRLSYHAINDGRLNSPLLNGKAASWPEAVKEAAKLIKSAGDKLIVIVSAGLSREEGRALLELFEGQFKAKLYLHVGGPGEEDEFLRRSDLNANARGLSELGLGDKLEGALGEDAVAVLFETLCPHPLPEGVKPRLTISPQVSEAVQGSAVALPAASYAESRGTVVNFDGVEQSYERALFPRGDSRPHLEIIEMLKKELAGGRG